MSGNTETDLQHYRLLVSGNEKEAMEAFFSHVNVSTEMFVVSRPWKADPNFTMITLSHPFSQAGALNVWMSEISPMSDEGALTYWLPITGAGRPLSAEYCKKHDIFNCWFDHSTLEAFESGGTMYLDERT